METDKNPRLGYMIAVSSVGFVIAVAVTICAAFLFVPEDRGFVFWMTVGFVVFVELVAYSFLLGLLTSKLGDVQITTPTIVSSWTVLVLYACVGTLSIIIYSFVRDADDPADGAFAAVLLIETAAAFLVVLALRSWDILFQARQPPIAEKREEHRASAMTVQPLLGKLQRVNFEDPARAVKRDRISKRLEVVQSALLHSHGGGVGSRETGGAKPLDPAIEAEWGAAIAELTDCLKGLEDGDAGERRLAEIEASVDRLDGLVSAIELD